MIPQQHRSRASRPLRAPIAVLAALLLVLVALPFSPMPANALTGLTVSFATDSTYEGTPVVESGGSVSVSVQVDRAVAPGTTSTIELTGGLSLPDGTSIAVTCDLIESARIEGGKILVTTAASYASTNTDQCGFTIAATVSQVEKSEIRQIGWTLDGQNHSTTIIVEASGDSPAPPASQSSSASKWGHFDSWTFGHTSASGEWVQDSPITIVDGKVSLDSKLIGFPIHYSATVYTQDGFTGSITDSLDAPFAFVDGSFAATLVTWDANGLNRTSASYAFPSAVTTNGSSATIPVDLPSRSQLSITYDVTIPDAAALESLRTALQAQYDAMKAAGGSLVLSVSNAFTVPEEGANSTDLTASSTIWIDQESVPAPSAAVAYDESAFAKTGGPSPYRIDDQPAADGTLEVPVPVTYTLKADLSRLVAKATSESPLPLTRNVLIEDVLPAYTQWSDDDPAFLTATGMTLTRVYGVTCDAQTMRSDAYIGTYCVDGQTFEANIGKDPTTVVSLALKARIVNVAGLWENKQFWMYPNVDSSYWNVPNTASFLYEDAKVDASATITVVRAPQNDGQNQGWVFAKEGPSAVAVAPGSAASIDYSFFIRASQVAAAGDPVGEVGFEDLVVTDHLDTSIFDLADKESILASIRAVDGYNASALALGPEHFTATLSDDGTLDIRFNDAGLAEIARIGAATVKILITIPTRVFAGKESLTVTNRATLSGVDSTPYNWSEKTTTLDSYGDEVSVDKFVRDRVGSAWVESSRVELNADGTPKDPYAVYRLEIRAHQKYSYKIHPIEDVLPADVEFIGFTSDGQVDATTPSASATIDLANGKLTAAYDSATRTVTVSQKTGVLTSGDGLISLDVLVRFPAGATLTENRPILNSVGSSTATLTPTNDYPLTIRKTDSTDLSKEISDENARFVVKDGTGPNARIVAGADSAHPIFVDQGYLRTTNADGEVVNVVVPAAGTYYVYETKAPKGYARASAPIVVTVGETGASDEAIFVNSPQTTPPVPITIVKQGLHCDTNADTCELAGASFALYEVDPASEGAQPVSGGIVPTTDAAVFTSIDLDYDTDYWLVETKAPEGHELLATPIAFTVTTDGGIQLDTSTSGLAEVSSTEGTSDRLVLNVRDPTRVDLPAAGGRGYLPFLAIGFGLMVAGAARVLTTSKFRLARRRA